MQSVEALLHTAHVIVMTKRKTWKTIQCTTTTTTKLGATFSHKKEQRSNDGNATTGLSMLVCSSSTAFIGREG